jgi:hypothetical protein
MSSATVAAVANPKNLRIASIEELSWATSDALKSLDAVRVFTEYQANDAIDWYYRRKRPKQIGSQSMRFCAIVLASVGGLVPIIVALPHVNPAWMLEKWGYVALGVAAACLGLDKFFGFSTGWVRYISAAQDIQKQLYAFQIDWARAMSKLGGNAPTPLEVDGFLQIAKDFSNRVMSEVEQETQQWIVEFQSSLAELQKTSGAQLDAARPGSLTVNVANASLADPPVTVNVDGTDYGILSGNSWTVRQIPPGPHVVTIRGTKAGSVLLQSGSVLVPPGSMAKLDLSFP